MNISIQNDANYPVDVDRLQSAATAVLEQENAGDLALTIVLTDDAEIARLNQQFRQVDAPTDVLSFPADAPPVVEPDEPEYLGDLVIAYPYATAQAKKLGHSESDSLCLLVVHGTLHLLGYDHDTQENRAEMWSAQAQALTALKIDTAIVPALEDDTSVESADD